MKAPGTAKRTPFLPAENMWLLNVVDANSFARKHHMNALCDHTSLQRPLDHFRSPCGLAKQGFGIEHLKKHWLALRRAPTDSNRGLG